MPIRILRSMIDPPEFRAEFIAMCDGAGHSIEMQWTGDGNNPRVAQRLADLRAAGVLDQHITLAGVADNVLNARHRATDIIDNVHTWSDADFAV